MVRGGLSEKVTCRLSPKAFSRVSHERCSQGRGGGEWSRKRKNVGKDHELGKNLAYLKKLKQPRMSGAQ